MDGDTVRLNVVSFPVKTSQVHIYPFELHKNIALRLELYGCDPGENDNLCMTHFRLSAGEH